MNDFGSREWFDDYSVLYSTSVTAPHTKDTLILENEASILENEARRANRPEAVHWLGSATDRPPPPPQGGRFVPSRELVEIVARGRGALLEAAPNTRRRITSQLFADAQAQNVEQIAEELTVRIERLFGSMGDEAQDADLPEVAVSVNGHFGTKVEYALSDVFAEVPMREASRFSTLLYRELLDFIERGGRLAGGWGRMVSRRGELALAIGPNPFLRQERAVTVRAEAMGSFEPK